MSFGQAVSTVFSKYATFSGRARRSEYWYWWLFIFIGTLVLYLVDQLIGWEIPGATAYGTSNIGWLTLLFALATIIPGIAVTIRRLHDTGRSGLWWLLSLVCGIGALVVFIFCLMDSTPDNEYGPNPKGGAVTA